MALASPGPQSTAMEESEESSVANISNCIARISAKRKICILFFYYKGVHFAASARTIAF